MQALGVDEGPTLALVDAPVGYGKTMLLQSWAAAQAGPVVWFTPDANDDDPWRMWTYLATGVNRIREGIGREALACLRVPGASAEAGVDFLMNGLASYGRPLSIVLDDLHLVAGEAMLVSLEHAIARLPPNVRLLAATRSDPAIGLARLRARGALVELRAPELAFTLDEAHEFLVERQGIALVDESVGRLVERTEGWPAGLYLAALWLRDQRDPDEAAEAFAGSNRAVADYLGSEVLAALEPGTRDFLVRTSVLRRFTPELCDEVLGRADSAHLLGELELSNLFIVALDAPGGWYRYHHLFRELLQLELRRASTVGARDIHRQAAAWFRRQGLVEGALEHAFEAGELHLVAELLAEHHLELIRSGRIRLLLDSAEELPGDVLASQPLVAAAAAIASGLLGRSRTETARLLALAERGRGQRPDDWTPYLEYAVEVVRAIWTESDAALAVQHARRAVTAARGAAEEAMVPALAALAHALFFLGDFGEARAVALQTVERPEAPERPHGTIGSLGVLAIIDAEEGRTESAEAWARQAIDQARRHGLVYVWPLGTARLGLALALAARGHLEEAEPEALRGESLRRTAEPTIGHAHALLVLAEVRVARSRLRRAAADLERAQRIISEFPRPGALVTAHAARVEEQLALAHADAADRDPPEELSPAELGVLRYLATDLSQREIGARLYISVNTVKSHAREVYRKLGVTSRAAAVARADAAGLLDSRESPG